MRGRAEGAAVDAHSRLEHVAETELEVARRVVAGRVRDAPGVRVVVARHANLAVGIGEVDVVEDVGGFDADLEPAAPLIQKLLKNETSACQKPGPLT